MLRGGEPGVGLPRGRPHGCPLLEGNLGSASKHGTTQSFFSTLLQWGEAVGQLNSSPIGPPWR